MKITRKNLNKCILIAGATLTTLTRSACGFEDALYTMFEQTDIPQRVKLEPDWKKVDVKAIIENSIECTPNSKKLFEEIAQDEVGCLALKVFYHGQKKLGKKLKILNKSYVNEAGESSSCIFVNEEFTIYLDLERLQKEPITTVGYCNRKIFPKKEAVINILFHEFVHAIHYIADDIRDLNSNLLDHLYGDNPDKYYWTAGSEADNEEATPDDEEIYTIDGLFLSDGKILFNPICSALFEASRQIKAGIKFEDISIRVFHCIFDDEYENVVSFDILEAIEAEVKTNLRQIFC